MVTILTQNLDRQLGCNMKKLFVTLLATTTVLAIGTELNRLERDINKLELENKGQADDIKHLRSETAKLGVSVRKLTEEGQGLTITSEGNVKGSLGVLKDALEQL